MTSVQQASWTNVQYTLNNWMATGLAAVNRPSWLPSNPAVVYNAPDIQASIPCFSIFHSEVDSVDRYMGRGVGGGLVGSDEKGMMEISAWASLNMDTNPNGAAQLNFMVDMVKTVAALAASMAVLDFAANPYNPVSTSYLVHTGPVKVTPTLPDITPDLRRVRMLLFYSWIYRA